MWKRSRINLKEFFNVLADFLSEYSVKLNLNLMENLLELFHFFHDKFISFCDGFQIECFEKNF